MSGKPAARQGDMTQYGGSIVQGSAGVRIGAPTGVACSGCPGGVTSGHPVNPSKMNNDPYRTTADNVISGTTSDVIREGTENAMVM